MADSPRGIAAATYIETTEGPVQMGETPNKGFPVLTRLPDGRLGFRQLIKVAIAEDVPLVRVVLDSGFSVVVAGGHPFFRSDGQAVAAERLGAGDLLDTAFHYREGYVPDGATRPVRGVSAAVRAVEAAGRGQVLTGTVRDTHALFLTAGIRCGE